MAINQRIAALGLIGLTTAAQANFGTSHPIEESPSHRITSTQSIFSANNWNLNLTPVNIDTGNAPNNVHIQVGPVTGENVSMRIDFPSRKIDGNPESTNCDDVHKINYVMTAGDLEMAAAFYASLHSLSKDIINETFPQALPVDKNEMARNLKNAMVSSYTAADTFCPK